MKKSLLTGNGAAAWAARLCEVDYVPAFPITPQTEIIENIAQWSDEKSIHTRLVTLESEHSMITAAGSAAVTGVRVFTATSSQGLLHGAEMLFTVSGWRAPFVLVNVSRGLASPITLESDHNDIMAVRDSGFLQIHCSTCQEILDSVILAYRLGEDPRVRLPVIVNLDGFYLSFTREPVLIPELSQVRKFLPPFDSGKIQFRASTPVSHAMAVLGGSSYSYFRYETHLAAENALSVYEEITNEFEKIFQRKYTAVDKYLCDDAEYVFIMIGSFSTKAKEAVDRLREDGQRVGLVKIRLLRPFPENDLLGALEGKLGAVIVDQNISMGKGGVIYTEVGSVFSRIPGNLKRPALLSFIGGLGGRDISQEEFFEMIEVAREAVRSGKVPEPRLLYTERELKEIRKLQQIAHVERQKIGSLQTEAVQNPEKSGDDNG